MRCERCGRAHATIERAVRYHMALYWSLPISKQSEELDFINRVKMGLPPDVNITVRLSEAAKILKENDV
jgi:hypothetical protein